MVPIKFVTDSAADIPRPLREELDIQVDRKSTRLNSSH